MKVFLSVKNHLLEELVKDLGLVQVKYLFDADILLFGGTIPDVSPILYDKEDKTKTPFSLARDREDIFLYKLAEHLNLPMIGIGRGAQFLNVMLGGKLHQQVINHNKAHPATIQLTKNCSEKREILVSSAHHQSIIPSEDTPYITLLTANVSTNNTGNVLDIEAIYYYKQRILCFQPHPEFYNHSECKEYFTSLITSYYLKD